MAWAYHNQIPVYPIFYVLEGDYSFFKGPTVADPFCPEVRFWDFYFLESWTQKQPQC